MEVEILFLGLAKDRLFPEIEIVSSVFQNGPYLNTYFKDEKPAGVLKVSTLYP